MPTNAPDPFLIEPELWYGVLCEGFGRDENGRINLLRVINTIYLEEPPRRAGLKAFAHLQAVLAVGFSHGVGEFSAAIELQDVDGKTLSARPEPWIFRVGPGEIAAASLTDAVEYWFTEPGNFCYVVTLSPGEKAHRVRFEVAPRPPQPTPPQAPA